MKLINTTVILLFFILLTACGKQPKVLNETKIEIPAIEVESNDPSLTRNRNGVLLINDQFFSGYVVAKYHNGAVESRKGYFNGRLEGLSLEYYENGSKKSKRLYKSGEKHGEHFGWYENKQMKFHYVFSNGLSIGNHKDWYQNGEMFKDYNYKDGHPFGSQKMWRTDGKLRANFVIREDGRKYGLTGLKRCSKIDSETENVDPYISKVE